MQLIIDPKEKEQIIADLKTGRLPDGRGWSLTFGGGFGLAHLAARERLLPSDFSEWGLMDFREHPVTHVAAERGFLPNGFRDWEIRDRIGRTVAHVAVQKKPLPPEFDLWTMRDRCGFNVAETACFNGNLPKGVTDWRNLIEKSGTPVNVVPPPWPVDPRLIAKGSGGPPMNAALLTTMRDISVGNDDDFLIDNGNFLDDFYRYDKKWREYLFRDAPEDMPECWQVPFLGATAAVLARCFDLEAPDWANQPRCFLLDDSPYWPYSVSEERRLIAPPDTPPEFRERNVFTSGYALYRV
jgi:hypothetical protein